MHMNLCRVFGLTIFPQVDLFHTPGQSDLTADVDFAILRKSASAVVRSVPIYPTCARAHAHF